METRDLNKIIGIYSEGYGAGKDSVANVISIEYGYAVFGFSEVLKKHIYDNLVHNRFSTLESWLEYCELHKYDGPEQEGAWVRKLLQAYGQFYRYLHPDYWVNEWQ